jgi:hypothetical protein
MHRNILLLLTSLIIAFLFFMGCSSPTPVSSDLMPQSRLETGTFGEKLLGLYEVTLDTDNMTINLAPVHSRAASAVGDIFFDLEITDFMVFPYCPDETCLMVGGLGVVDDSANGDITSDIAFDIYVKHPFGRFNSSQPPSGFNRADLDIFNPKLYILTAGNQDPLVMTSEAGKIIDTGLTNPLGGTVNANLNFVQNADGWGSTADANSVNATDGLTPEETSILLTYQEPTEYPGTDAHPYFNFFYGDADDGGTDSPTSDDCRMSQGEDADMRTVQLNLEPGEGEITFGLAIAGAYGQSAQGKVNRVPASCKYFVPAFNTHTPIITDITVVKPDTVGMTNGSIAISVRDMQADSSGVAASKDAYKMQVDGGSLLPPEIIDFSTTSYPIISGLTLDDYLVGGNGSLEYRMVDSDDTEIIALTTLAGATATGTGTAADPYVFTINLDYTMFSAGRTYIVYMKVNDGLAGTTLQPIHTVTYNWTKFVPD